MFHLNTLQKSMVSCSQQVPLWFAIWNDDVDA